MTRIPEWQAEDATDRFYIDSLLDESKKDRPLADLECDHGRLPGDLGITCACWDGVVRHEHEHEAQHNEFPHEALIARAGDVPATAPAPCEWFLLCANEATTTRPHPVLGDVPCCDRCAAFVDSDDPAPPLPDQVLDPGDSGWRELYGNERSTT